MSEESREIAVMRRMAWCRAKGELMSMLETCHNNDNFTELSAAINDFVAKVEGNGLTD